MIITCRPATAPIRGWRSTPFAVHSPPGPEAKFEQRGIRIEEQRYTFPRGETPFLVLALNGLGPAAQMQRLFLASEVFGGRGRIDVHVNVDLWI
jgi:hypothetical protein